MKFIFPIALSMFIISNTSLFSQNQKESVKNIEVSVENITSNQGKVSFALYNKFTFMKEPIAAKSSTITNGVSRVVFTNVKAGDYSILCFHDKNSNNRMDFDNSGKPLEDYGASNNVLSYGPPVYEDSKFTVVNKDVSLKIKF